MKAQTLTEIRNLTIAQMEKQGISQNRFAKQAGVSPATITALMKCEWDKFSPSMTQKLAIACGYEAEEWKTADTTNLRLVHKLCATAQRECITIAIIDEAGRGKTEGFKSYPAKNVFHLQCSRHWTNKVFLEKFLQAMGIDGSTFSSSEKCELIIKELGKLTNPLVILDETDKLRTVSLLFIIELYNRLDGYCGFIIAGNPALRDMINRGVAKKTCGFPEIYSRIGRRFINLKPITFEDVRNVAQANGIFEEDHINQLFNDCEDDMRRVSRAIKVLRNKMTPQPQTA